MPHFFFHVRRDNVIYEYHEGLELASVEEAVRQAVEDVRDIMRDDPTVPRTIQWMEIVDHEGNTVRTVPFGTVAPH